MNDTNVKDLFEAERLAAENDDDGPLVEELADTATIDTLLDAFIAEVGEMFNDTLEISVEGNPVRTHLELVSLAQDAIELAYLLKRDLIRTVANRAEEITEQGHQLRKQVIEES